MSVLRKTSERFLGNDIKEVKAEDIIERLDSGTSLMKSFGAFRLWLTTATIGWLIRFVIRLVLQDSKKNQHQRILRFINSFFPTRVVRNNCQMERIGDKTGIVAYFNHQSRFEALATISWCLTNFEKKPIVLPANISWYEILATIREDLESAGIIVIPMITPKTVDLMRKNRNIDIEVINEIKSILDQYYFSRTIDCVLSGGIIALAPTATRTAAIFPSYEEYCCEKDEGLSGKKPMKALVASIQRKLPRTNGTSPVDIFYIPFGITRKGFRTRGLNLFRKHDVHVGDGATHQDMMKLLRNGRLEHFVLHQLTDLTPEELHYPPETRPGNT
ncbi:MAG: hypothetical protein ACOX0Z_03790 [Candidatus Nanosyncoccaceae bacterium]